VDVPEWLTWDHVVDVAQLVTAVGALLTATLVAWLPHHRRPSLSLAEDVERIHSRVEGDGVPYIRILACNKRGKRAAKGTRVVLEGYRRADETRLTSLASPLMTWPSATEAVESATVVVLPGGRRPVSLGRLIRTPTDSHGRPALTLVTNDKGEQGLRYSHQPDDPAAIWMLMLDATISVTDTRDWLAPGEWIVQLTVGSDDSDARTFRVDVTWDAGAKTSEAAKNYLLAHLHVKKAAS
jgi:hypothetical protein